MTKDEALRLALEALEYLATQIKPDYEHSKAITAIKAALEAKDEPVSSYGYCPVCGAKGAIRERHPDGNTICVNRHTYKSRDALLTPPQRKPLTDEEVLRLLSKIDECAVRLPRGLREFARAIEAAHGIKGEA